MSYGGLTLDDIAVFDEAFTLKPKGSVGLILEHIKERTNRVVHAAWRKGWALEIQCEAHEEDELLAAIEDTLTCEGLLPASEPLQLRGVRDPIQAWADSADGLSYAEAVRKLVSKHLAAKMLDEACVPYGSCYEALLTPWPADFEAPKLKPKHAVVDKRPHYQQLAAGRAKGKAKRW